jgi:hypothetical protein
VEETNVRRFIVLGLVTALTLITYTYNAEAGGCGRGCGGGGCNSGFSQQAPTPEELQAQENFFNDTAALREQLFEKRAEYFDVLSQDNPDKDLAAQIWSEMFDLQTQLREKAAEAGIETGFGPGPGPRGCGQGCGGPQGDGAPCNAKCDNTKQCNNPSCRWNS